MPNKCERCKKLINNTHQGLTCPCGKILCHTCNLKNKHILNTLVSNGYGSGTEFICIDHVLKYGERGLIIHNVETQEGFEGVITIKDPDYEVMKQKISHLEEENIHLRYAYGGIGYQKAKEDFDNKNKN